MKHGEGIVQTTNSLNSGAMKIVDGKHNQEVAGSNPAPATSRKWSSSEDQILLRLYSKQKILIGQICRILDRSPGAISGRLGTLKAKRNNKFQKDIPLKMTPALARIHAHVCGDGYLYYYREKDNYGPWAIYRKNGYHRTRYLVCYTNTNESLLKEFRGDIKNIFGINGKKKIHKHTLIVSSKRVWAVLKNLGAGKSHEWYVPKVILSASLEIKRNWIRAFFDDEAYFGKGKRIRVKIVNKKGLKQIQRLLNNFLPSVINPKQGSYREKRPCRGAYSLDISRKFTPEYFGKIGSLRFRK
ncbi:MAG: hypothetical protein HY451_01230 [Parcubacteria group bacterium]|nr:hypothetical protein [Parcubacteria group bacterium]